jgi:hypothetical protein
MTPEYVEVMSVSADYSEAGDMTTECIIVTRSVSEGSR